MEKGGDRQRLLLYENNIIDVLVDSLLRDSSADAYVNCLKSLRVLLNSASKMNSLDLNYTSYIKNDL